MDTYTVRAIVLITLTIQNAGQSIVMTQSRMPDSSGRTYDASFAVLMQEVIKVVLSLIFLLGVLLYRCYCPALVKDDILLEESRSHSELSKKSESSFIAQMYQALERELYTADAIKMILPAALYVIQNHLQLMAASELDATTFSIFSQMKIISTAIFTVSFLGRKLNRKQWLSVIGLFLGVVLVQVSPKSSPSSSSSHLKITSDQDSTLGLLALSASCILSGFAGVYTEKLMTRSTSSIFANSLQMSLCSMIPAASPILRRHLQSSLGLAPKIGVSPFAPFGVWAWMAVLYNVWGGFIVAITMKVSSSLAKSFATSVAVVLTFLISFVVLHESFSIPRILGASVVIISVYTYSASACQAFTVNIGLDTDAQDRSNTDKAASTSTGTREARH